MLQERILELVQLFQDISLEITDNFIHKPQDEKDGGKQNRKKGSLEAHLIIPVRNVNKKCL